ncbi:aspartate/glutamate racemase family protein [Bosea sp. (in: a-proteobacteria)]|uniref:aspartate/glutamate racemase family protein n=1 Tax=Bosea sp. (in: a-proteobacteria) TaxID=1871050 RepID=UPI002DDD5FA8|nr:aspartate/glutamate racemase family protein [Bosea sp. (in: a-proteobacteria)]HEV2513108.1 aspartate/glutamate racemase family protein [Bosea sp. (in: a-proteobacteria)]
MTPHILLINPNSSQATSAMMQAIAQRAAGDVLAVAVATAKRSPAMIVTEGDLLASADEVVEIGIRHAPDCVGIIVSAFGDPGLETLRQQVDIPVAGICEASMRMAAQGGRRFGVATTTPKLVDAIAARASALGLAELLAGIRCTAGDPAALTDDKAALTQALGEVVDACIAADDAQAVIIGGGPLGEAAGALESRFSTPVIAPIPAAVAAIFERMQR